jgi:hypothetical protein
MKSFILLMIAVIITGSFQLFSADDQITVRNRAGDMALGLNVVGVALVSPDLNNSLGIFNGIDGQYSLAQDLQFRASLLFTTHSKTTKAASGNTNGVDQVETQSLFTIAPGLRYIFAHNTNIQGYLGGEVIFGMNSNSTDGINNVKDNNTKTSNTNFGVGAFIGAEWFAWKNVSFSIEYQLAFLTKSGTEKNTFGSTSVSTDAPAETWLGLGFSVTHLTVNFYFN